MGFGGVEPGSEPLCDVIALLKARGLLNDNKLAEALIAKDKPDASPRVRPDEQTRHVIPRSIRHGLPSVLFTEHGFRCFCAYCLYSKFQKMLNGVEEMRCLEFVDVNQYACSRYDGNNLINLFAAYEAFLSTTHQTQDRICDVVCVVVCVGFRYSQCLSIAGCWRAFSRLSVVG